MATEGTPFRDRYASEARAAAARAHAPPMEEPPTPVPRRVNSPEPRAAAPTPTPPSKLLQRYLASEATKIPEAPGALEAEVRARTRALELEVARADSAHTTYHGRRRVRNGGDGLDGAARGVDAAAKAVLFSRLRLSPLQRAFRAVNDSGVRAMLELHVCARAAIVVTCAHPQLMAAFGVEGPAAGQRSNCLGCVKANSGFTRHLVETRARLQARAHQSLRTYSW